MTNETYDAIGTLIAKDGWRKVSPYSTTELFKPGDRLIVQWNGESGLPKGAAYGGAKAIVVKVNPKRLLVAVSGWGDLLSIRPSHVAEIFERPTRAATPDP
jgi:hypothetical protein